MTSILTDATGRRTPPEPMPTLWARLWDSDSAPTYWLTRFAILRLLGLVYFIAFWTLVNQGLPLLGADGLLPVTDYLGRAGQLAGSRTDGFFLGPSVFWLYSSDGLFLSLAWIGAALSLVVLIGYANGVILFVLWGLYLSFVHVGQTWYSFGWEIQLLETGFLAIFLCPLLDARPFPERPPPVLIIWLYRWLIVRIMLGAALIKLRGDPCWRDLTCLAYHYETQPIPNPLSRVLHFMPVWFHKLGALCNYLAELVAPFFAFWPRRARHLAGAIFVVFQLVLIASGNLAFLNWLTIVPALACFDDGFLKHVLPQAIVKWSQSAAKTSLASKGPTRLAVSLVFVLVVVLSVQPMANLISSRQIMNTSFDRLHLVNTYGAFGSVGRERHELIFEGTSDEVITDDTQWKEYEFQCKPGAVDRRPCIITPYHYRLDWLIWFAAMGTPDRYPWTVHLLWKMLTNDRNVLTLLAKNPFPDEPPRYVRVDLYRYQFAPRGERHWWRRERIGSWIPPLSADDPRLREFLSAAGWLKGEKNR